MRGFNSRRTAPSFGKGIKVKDLISAKMVASCLGCGYDCEVKVADICHQAAAGN